jgi:hypothetical protein
MGISSGDCLIEWVYGDCLIDYFLLWGFLEVIV